MEDNQDDNFEENEFMYEDLDLDDLSQTIGRYCTLKKPSVYYKRCNDFDDV